MLANCNRFRHSSNIRRSWKISKKLWQILSDRPQAVQDHFNQYGVDDGKPKPPTYLVNAEAIPHIYSRLNQLITTQMSREIHSPLREFESKAFSKWVGPQGRVPSLKKLHSLAAPYYDAVDSSLSIGDFSAGIKALIAEMLASGFVPHSLRLGSIAESLAKYPGDKKSSSGIRLWADRRDSEVQQLTLNYALRYPLLLDSAVLMHRNQRNKFRTVFNDEFANLLKVSRFVNDVQEVCKTLPGFEMSHGMYYYDLVTAADLCRPFIGFEGDYESMDVNYSLSLVKATVQPVLFFMYNEAEHQTIEILHEALFRIPLVVSKDEIWTGLHNLFSGITITNLYESIMNWILQATLLLETPYYEKGCSTRSLYDVAKIHVMGDDSAVQLFVPVSMYGRKWENRYGHHTLTDLFVIYGKLAGLPANSSKQREAVNNYFFCKRWHSISNKSYTHVTGIEGKYSVYPLMLVFNSALNPERGANHLMEQELMRILQIFDNAYGHPLWKPALDLFWSRLRLPEGKKLKDIYIDPKWVEDFNQDALRDFKHILNGEYFTLESSPAYQYLTGRQVLDPVSRIGS